MKKMGRGRRLLLGVLVLLLVDIIWVASSELTEFIFNESGFNKPFFSTYLKTSMFMVYLLGFLVWTPWRHQCIYQNHHNDQDYQVVDTGEDEEDGLASPDRRLSESKYVPIKVTDTEKHSDAESDDSSVKSVKFSKLTEVRQMAEAEAVEAMMSRLSFSASLRAEHLFDQAANKLPIKGVMKIAAIFCVLWFLGNYSYGIALSDTEAGVVNMVSSTSGLFTLILAAIFPAGESDRFTLSKLCSVLIMVVGVVLVSIEDLTLESSALPVGVLWSLVGAVVYAMYMVFLRRKVPSEDRMDFTMFFGFVGLFNVILLWPGFLLLDLLDWEKFEWPNSEQLMYMAINGIIGTVLSELLWLWGCFLTSSLMATLSLSLTIPLTMAVDTWLKGIHYSWLFYVGAIPMMISFLSVTLFTHYETWDPVWDGINALYSCICQRNTMYSLVDSEIIERESLIEDSNCGITNLGLEDDDDDSISDGDIGDAQVRDLDEVDKRSIGSASDSFSSHQQSNGLTASVQSTVVSSNIMNHV